MTAFEPAASSDTTVADGQSSLTVAQWMSTWFDTFLNVGKSTRQRYEIDIRLHIVPGIGDISLAQLTALDIQRLYNALLQKGLSAKSVKNLHGILHSALATALKMELVQKNVTDACTLPHIEKKEMHTLADQRLTAFLQAAAVDEFYPAFYVCLFTGLRESELLGLTWDCIDFENSRIRVYRQFRRQNFHNEKSVWKFSSLKNKKERTIVVPSQVIQMLKNIKAKQKVSQARNNTTCLVDHDFVFTKKNGEFIQTSQLYRHFKKIVTQMGCPDVRFHDLRHTYATIAIQSGTDVKTVSSNLGHATVAFTMDQYAHVSEMMKKNSASLMENFIETTCKTNR